ncbi:MAG: FKBP-type peptidyl-prolyl cis-trans isomerase, partial [Algisphaera sp.]
GATASAGDTVTLHYTGTLIDGTTFDSSQGGEPVAFPVTAVIPGFSEGLQLLPVGTKAKLYIPAELAYGDSPQGPGGPGSTLIFDVEMLGIEGAAAELSLEEQMEQAKSQMEEDIKMIREQTESRIKALQSELDGGAKAGASAGDGKDLMFD